MVEWSRAKRLVLQCINGVNSNPVEGRTEKLIAQKSNFNTVWFNFNIYVYFFVFCKHRCSSHRLPVGTGRRYNLSRNYMLCLFCM